MSRRLAAVLAAAAVLSIGVGVAACAARLARPATATFVGSAACAQCHAGEYAAWKGSQHAVAMQDAQPGAVLGRFDSTRFTDGKRVTTFFRRGGRFYVNTEGADGALHDYPIRYTFGVWPLQQYLVELAGGHVQTLTMAWDARPKDRGGQRWFSLTPGQEIAHTDEYFWTGREYNWNYMCADCHSTGVRKRYDSRTDAFNTTFSEIDVSCEACHGPGSAHAAWGGYPSWLRAAWRNDGLLAQLTERRGVRWSIDSTTGNARRSQPRTTDREIEACAQCHARRAHIADGYTAGARLLDYYTPLLLIRGLYHSDGQQLDEVYTYASFLESRMNANGVTCADCHDPHTDKLRRPGNGVCAQCHRAATYDTPAHHFHIAGTAGSMCVNCHLPATTYMQVDPRHDHSIRIPRPDLTLEVGVPNACNRCHTDRDAQWAVAQLRAHYPTPNPGFQRFATAFATDDSDRTGAADSLAAVANDATEPPFVRASALSRLAGHPGPLALQASRAWSRDPNGMVRHAALQILEAVPAEQRVAIAEPLLSDSMRAVRQEAAWVLAPAAASLPLSAKQAFDNAAAEFIGSQEYNADRAPAHLTLGTFYVELGRLNDAATQFRAALQLSPHLTEASVNLADVLRAQGHDADAEQALRNGLAASPNDPTLHYALGLTLARANRKADALSELRRASALAPDDPAFSYAYAVALNTAGRARDAIAVLNAARAKHPSDRDLLFALATFSRDAGDRTSALRYARQLVAAHPDDAEGKALAQSLQTGGRSR